MNCSPTAPVLGGIVLATVLAVAAMLPASADVRIRSSPGGAVEAYLAAFARVRQSGQRVVIDGPCLSACTLVLSTIPRNRICVTRRAVLGFHAPRWYDLQSGRTTRAPEATRAVTAIYPRRGARLDQKARRAHTESYLPSRQGAFGSLSALLEGGHEQTGRGLP